MKKFLYFLVMFFIFPLVLCSQSLEDIYKNAFCVFKKDKLLIRGLNVDGDLLDITWKLNPKTFNYSLYRYNFIDKNDKDLVPIIFIYDKLYPKKQVLPPDFSGIKGFSTKNCKEIWKIKNSIRIIYYCIETSSIKWLATFYYKRGVVFVPLNDKGRPLYLQSGKSFTQNLKILKIGREGEKKIMQAQMTLAVFSVDNQWIVDLFYNSKYKSSSYRYVYDRKKKKLYYFKAGSYWTGKYIPIKIKRR